jgi:hypothetical protein
MPLAAALNGATPATRKATAAVRMSPPPITTGFHSLGRTLSASNPGFAKQVGLSYPKCATDVSLAS